jgi:hypothetical protein
MKVLVDQEEEKKDQYLARCHELRKDFTPMIYSVDGMLGREAKMAEKWMASYLSKKWYQHYSQMVPFVRLRIWLSIAMSNTLLIHGSRELDAARPFVQSVAVFHER